MVSKRMLSTILIILVIVIIVGGITYWLSSRHVSQLKTTQKPKTPSKSASSSTSVSQSPFINPTGPNQILIIGAADMEPDTLDPAICYSSSCMRVIRLTYEKLVDYNGSKIVGDLAVKWEVSKNGTVWTFWLRRGVRFHDGTPFNATAVKFSIERLLAIDKGPAWMFEDIEKVVIVGPYEVKIILKHPDPAFLEKLAAAWGLYIVSPSCVKAHATKDDPWATKWLYNHDCGSGPYILVKWLHHQYIILKAWRYYWRGWSGKHIYEVIIKEILSPETQKMELLSGEIDIMNDVPPRYYYDLKNNPQVVVKAYPSYNELYLFFNTMKFPCNLRQFRLAIAYAINRSEIVKVVLLGLGRPAYYPAPSTMPKVFHNITGPRYNIEKAIKLLDEVKSELEGKVIKLQCAYVTGDTVEERVCEMLQAFIQKLDKLTGLKIQIVPTPYTWDTLYDLVMNHPKQAPALVMLWWWPDYADPLDYYYPMFSSNGSYAFSHLKDPVLDHLLKEAYNAANSLTYMKLLKKIQERIIYDCPAAFILEQDYIVAFRRNVRGYVYNPLFIGSYNVYTMWKS
ncbi:MAG: ABC transporter substrate-binding protein [Crenarchaeota archaeon]|nr:ABC transporter substrate-binding protein [Thermoproteota archaeon]